MSFARAEEKIAVDVAVVGAGPGGSAAACHLARAGLRVALVDRATFPRAKTCGDALTPRALEHIGRIGARTELGEIRPVDALVSVDLLDDHRHHGPMPGLMTQATTGAVIRRVVLDAALCAAAQRAGARFLPGTEVRTLERRAGRVVGIGAVREGHQLIVEAATTVLAEGSSGRLGRLIRASDPGPAGLALRRYFRVPAPPGRALRIYVPLLAGRESLCGYGWAFPVDDELVNVGVGWFARGPGASRPDLTGVFDWFIASLRRVEPFFSDARVCGPLEGGWIPCGFRPEDASVPGALLVGDAAGVANPFTGEGIAQALESGRAAAHAIIEHLGTGRDLSSEYAGFLRESFPSGAIWADALAWLAERGGHRSREFWELISGRVGVIGRGARSLVLDEPRRDGEVVDSKVEGTSTAIQGRLTARFPLLGELVGAVCTELAPQVSRVLQAYQRASLGTEPDDGALALELLALMAMLADDVRERRVDEAGERLAERSDWAIRGATLAVVDLLVAEAFSVLARLPEVETTLFTRHACAIFARAIRRAHGDNVDRGVGPLIDDLITVASALSRSVEPAGAVSDAPVAHP